MDSEGANKNKTTKKKKKTVVVKQQVSDDDEEEEEGEIAEDEEDEENNQGNTCYFIFSFLKWRLLWDCFSGFLFQYLFDTLKFCIIFEGHPKTFH